MRSHTEHGNEENSEVEVLAGEDKLTIAELLSG